VYPHAAAQAAAPTEASPRWLLVAEGAAETDPLASDAGGLLDNMLHALHLRQQPQVFICVLTPLTAQANSAAAAPNTPSQVLTQAITDIQPAVLLVMGRAAARSVLGRSEPLGQLRSQSLRIAGVPTVVTYDAAYLLRAPSAKAGAWDDLCRASALALVP
jgi:DNA polymerase